jgi:hypothetical protein
VHIQRPDDCETDRSDIAPQLEEHFLSLGLRAQEAPFESLVSFVPTPRLGFPAAPVGLIHSLEATTICIAVSPEVPNLRKDATQRWVTVQAVPL